MQGTAEDLSQAEEASARGLSNMVLLDSAEETQRLDQFGEQKSESGGESDSIPDDSCSPVSSPGSVGHPHHYSSGQCPGSISWAHQCPSEDEDGPVSGGEEHASHVAMDGDTGEETPTASRDEQGPAKEPLEEMGEPDGTVGAADTLSADSQNTPTNSQDEVTVPTMEEEIRGLD